MCAATDGPEWAAVSTQCSTEFLVRFQDSIRREDKDQLKTLVHPSAVIYGDSVCHKPQAKLFTFDLKKAKILPLDRAYALVLVTWKIHSQIIGGTSVKGRSTFVLYMSPVAGNKIETTCVHAHFSAE